MKDLLQVMQEMLYFIYTGKTPNLAMYALDLLAVADRYQLQGLKDMADQVRTMGGTKRLIFDL